MQTGLPPVGGRAECDSWATSFSASTSRSNAPHEVPLTSATVLEEPQTCRRGALAVSERSHARFLTSSAMRRATSAASPSASSVPSHMRVGPRAQATWHEVHQQTLRLLLRRRWPCHFASGTALCNPRRPGFTDTNRLCDCCNASCSGCAAGVTCFWTKKTQLHQETL